MKYLLSPGNRTLSPSRESQKLCLVTTLSTHLIWIIQERNDFIPGPPPHGRDGGVFGAQFTVFKGRQLPLGSFGIDSLVNSLQSACDGIAVFVANKSHGGPQKMDDAGLHLGLGEDRLYGLGDALEAIDGGDQDILNPATQADRSAPWPRTLRPHWPGIIGPARLWYPRVRSQAQHRLPC